MENKEETEKRPFGNCSEGCDNNAHTQGINLKCWLDHGWGYDPTPYCKGKEGHTEKHKCHLEHEW